MYKMGSPYVKRRIPSSQTFHSRKLLQPRRFQIHLSLITQFSALLIALLASIILIVALPTGISFSEDLKAAIAQKRTEERDFAIPYSLSEEKRAYQLEILELATFK